jgi:hypothetical protein
MNSQTNRVGLTPQGTEVAIESVSSPDLIQSPFGELRFFDGVPLPQTVATIYDGLDLIRQARSSDAFGPVARTAPNGHVMPSGPRPRIPRELRAIRQRVLTDECG